MATLIGNTKYYTTTNQDLGRARKATEKDKKLGVSGTEIYGHEIQTERTTILKLVQWDDSYEEREERVDEMLTDSVVESVINTVKLPIKSAPVSIEPASEDNIDLQVAEALDEDLLKNPHFDFSEVMDHILTYMDYGNAILMKSFERAERTRWVNWSFRRPETIDKHDVDLKGNLWRVHQTAVAVDGTHISQWIPEKRPVGPGDNPIFHIAYKQIADNFRGITMLRQAWRPYVIKRQRFLDFAHQSELASSGIPHAEWQGDIPASGTTERKAVQKALESVKALSRNYLETNKDVKISAYGGSELVGIDLIPGLHYLDQQIATSVLAGFLEQGKNGVGSHAKQKSDIELFMDMEEAHARHIETCLNRGRRGMSHVQQYVDLNFNVKEYPKVRLAQINTMDIEKLAKVITMYVNAGGELLPQDWVMIRERFGLAQVDVDELERRVGVVEENNRTIKELAN